jgi:histidyl-tRNA synthetase
VLPSFSRVDVIGVPLGEAARARLVAVAGELRAAGVRTDLVYGGKSMKAGFKAADKSGARFALVLGERDLEAGQIGIKTLATGEQVTVALTDVVEAVRKAL